MCIAAVSCARAAADRCVNFICVADGGADYVVYKLLPLRVWRVDHASGRCWEAATVTPPSLLALLHECNAVDQRRTPRLQQSAWRQCTGSREPFPPEGKRLRRFSLSLGGGTPGISWAPAARSTNRATDEILFVGHVRLADIRSL